jgi:hypothetical protein
MRCTISTSLRLSESHRRAALAQCACRQCSARARCSFPGCQKCARLKARVAALEPFMNPRRRLRSRRSLWQRKW